MRKRKGFTLIEMIGVLSIITISIGIGVTSYKCLEEYKVIEVENKYLNEVCNLIVESRKNCIKENQVGEIDYDIKNKELYFKRGSKVIKTIKSPEEIDLNMINIEFLIKINSNGDLDSSTFNFRGRKSNNKYKITIGVGFNAIRVYKNEVEI